MDRVVGNRYIAYIGVKFVWYTGDVIRPSNMSKTTYCIWADGSISYYDRGNIVRVVLADGTVMDYL